MKKKEWKEKIANHCHCQCSEDFRLLDKKNSLKVRRIVELSASKIARELSLK